MISIVTDVDPEELEYYRVCGKYYDEFMTRYYDKINNEVRPQSEEQFLAA